MIVQSHTDLLVLASFEASCLIKGPFMLRYPVTFHLRGDTSIMTLFPFRPSVYYVLVDTIETEYITKCILLVLILHMKSDEPNCFQGQMLKLVIGDKLSLNKYYNRYTNTYFGIGKQASSLHKLLSHLGHRG